jgi:hypothetical protein
VSDPADFPPPKIECKRAFHVVCTQGGVVRPHVHRVVVACTRSMAATACLRMDGSHGMFHEGM